MVDNQGESTLNSNEWKLVYDSLKSKYNQDFM